VRVERRDSSPRVAERAERVHDAEAEHAERDAVGRERRERQGVVVVAALRDHGDADDREQRDRDPLAGEDHDGGEPDREVREHHREREAGEREPHPPQVHPERREERLRDVRRARVHRAGERDVHEEQDPR